MAGEDWDARFKEIENENKRRGMLGNQAYADAQARVRQEQARANKIDSAVAAAPHGITGQLSPELQNQYAELIAAGKTTEAQMLIGNSLGAKFMEEREDPAYQPDKISGAQSEYNDAGNAATFDAVNTGMAREYQAAMSDGAGPLKPVERGGPLGEAHGAQYERVAGADLDTTKADQVRSKQDNYLNMLQARASGQTPSVAEASYNAKMGDVANNAMGIAAQARGSDRAYAKLRAIDAISDNTRKAGFESAQLRAQEMGQAESALGAGLGNVRGQDVDTAKTAAQLRQEALLSNQQTGAQTSQFNASARNRNDETNLATDMQNAAAGNDRVLSEAQLRQGNNQFNAGATTAANAANATTANTRQDNIAAATNAANATNAAAINARGDARAAGKNNMGQFNAGQTQNAATTNQAAGLQANAQEVGRKAGLAGTALTGTGQAAGLQSALLGKPKDPSTFDRVLGAVTTLGAGAIASSDERVKKDVDNVSTGSAKRLANALTAKEWTYKGDDSGERHAGFMAQDLEKDPLGKNFVHDGDDGIKRVDYGQMASMLLAAALRDKKGART